VRQGGQAVEQRVLLLAQERRHRQPAQDHWRGRARIGRFEGVVLDRNRRPVDAPPIQLAE